MAGDLDGGIGLRACTALIALAVVGAALVLSGCEIPQTGSISVSSIPAGARIFLDRSDTGRVTPYIITDVSAGSHSIDLTLSGHSDWGPFDVHVTAGQITTVTATLEPTDPQGPNAPSERGLGLKRLDVQAYQSANIIRADPVSLPSSVDLSVDAPIPGDQGLQGSCVGWAVAYVVKTYHERIERGWPLTDNRHVMSPAYVYNQIKVPGGGAYFVDAFTLLVDQGVSSWAQMPYDPLDDRTQPSSRARVEAANYKIADWGTVLRNTHAVFVQEIKRHLVAGDPVLIGIPVYPDFENLSESNPVYDEDGGGNRGSHAVAIVGYDDRRSAFKIANSWGTDWGIGGYGWIDYDASESLIWMAYVTRDVVASPDDERPGQASNPSPGNAAAGVAVDTVLRWTRNARTTSFDVYLGVDPHPSAVDFQGTVAQAEFTSHLAPGSVYYWRVDARGAGGITRGLVWTFTTAGVLEQPGKAVNRSPSDGATGVVRNPELLWDSGGHTTSYDVYFGTDPVLGASDLRRTQATRTYRPRGLRAETRYYWRIDAKNGQGTTTGDIWTFTTVQAREQDTSPVLPTISNKTYHVGDYVSERLPAATGGNGSLTYSLTPRIPGPTFDAATRTLSGTPREAGTYRMRYRVQDEDGDTDSQSFTVTVQQGNRPPFIVRLINPVSLQIGKPWTLTLSHYFGDRDGDMLTYTATSSKEMIAVVSPPDTDSMITITAVALGKSTITVTASDGVNDAISLSFTVTVKDDQPPQPTGFAWERVNAQWSGGHPRLRRPGGSFRGVAWNGARFVAVNNDGYIWHSRDGISWEGVLIPEGIGSWGLFAVAWNGTRFVAVGDGIVHSADGISWEVALEGALTDGQLFDSVASNGSRFVAVRWDGYQGSRIWWYSADGITWRESSFTRSWLSGLASNGTRFVATGRYGEIWHSVDGVNWSRAIGGPSIGIGVLAWGGGIFVATEFRGGYLWHSADGITWRRAANKPHQEGFSGMMWNGERFIGWGSYRSERDDNNIGYVYHSTDGISWARAAIEELRVGTVIKEVAGDTTHLVAVTNDAMTILTSP